MQLAGHASAAMEVLSAIIGHHQPATAALRDWGRVHRFAGSHDRQVIGTIVFDALRRRASLAWRMGNDSPRALVLGWLRFEKGLAPEAIAALAKTRFGPGALSSEEQIRLADPHPLEAAPAWVRADVPKWLFPQLAESLGGESTAIAHGQALARRAPLDIRVNTLKSSRQDVSERLARFSPQETPHSPWGLRFLPDAEGRLPRVEADMAHGLGLFEVQDEGSQIAALLTGARPGETVLDLCAGAGGKTLALAAMMHNEGRIVAFDADRLRLRPMAERLLRAGVTCVEVIEPHTREKLAACEERMDLVLVDAPCSGTGTWRRRPDSKWRLKSTALAKRLGEQDALLRQAVRHVRPGGRLVYVTCSLLKDENENRIQALLADRPDLKPLDWRRLWPETAESARPDAPAESPYLRLSPHTHGTDGFFIAVLERAGS